MRLKYQISTINKDSEKENKNNSEEINYEIFDNIIDKDENFEKQASRSVSIKYEEGNYEHSFEDNLNIAEILDEGEEEDIHSIEEINKDLQLNKLNSMTSKNFVPESVIKEVSIIKEDSSILNEKQKVNLIREVNYILN